MLLPVIAHVVRRFHNADTLARLQIRSPFKFELC